MQGRDVLWRHGEMDERGGEGDPLQPQDGQEQQVERDVEPRVEEPHGEHDRAVLDRHMGAGEDQERAEWREADQMIRKQ